MAKKAPRLRLIDTTFRDAQQSLLGGNLRGDEIVPIAAKMDAIGFTAMEAFGGATFETQVRRRENPWEYLRNLAKVTPNTPIQALIRGQNLLANRNFPDDVVELFIKHAVKCGVDVFRIFDPLNDLRNMEATVAAALKAKKKVQGALSYAISPAHNLELWCSLAKGLVNMGCHEVVIKDTSGLLSPQATWELVAALKETVNVPIDVHSHCSSGMAPMAYMAAVEAGAEILDVAMSPLAWGTSQPAVESVVAALKGGEYDTGLDLDIELGCPRGGRWCGRRHVGQRFGGAGGRVWRRSWGRRPWRFGLRLGLAQVGGGELRKEQVDEHGFVVRLKSHLLQLQARSAHLGLEQVGRPNGDRLLAAENQPAQLGVSRHRRPAVQTL
jgi:pyruvate carboxylase